MPKKSTERSQTKEKEKKPKLVLVTGHMAALHDQPAEGGREMIEEALYNQFEKKKTA